MNKSTDAWAHLTNFERIIYTVGDGVKQKTINDLNTMSTANAHYAAHLSQKNPDSVIFIAGGNSGENSPRPTKMSGARTEAERMKYYIRETLGSNVPICTDCDGEFMEQTGRKPSGNTPDNAANATAFIQLQPEHKKEIAIPTERLHLARVIGTLRKELHKLELLSDTEIHAHPIYVPFDEESDQEHICSENAFVKWETIARIHHVVTGKVLRKEFLHEWLSGRNYSNLHKESFRP